MNLRCTYCQTPFTVGRLEKLAAIQRMQAEDLHHFDVFCPRCRRATSVSRQRLEIFTPGWQEGLKTLEADAAKIEKGRTEPTPVPVEAKPAPAHAESRSRHTSKATVAAKSPVETKSAPKTVAKAKPAAKTAAKPAVKKPVAKAKPAASPKGKKPAAKKK
jgi:hypothetical protein